MRRLPDGFRLGAATAAYQIEGAVSEDGRGRSIWDTFSETPGAVLGGDTGAVACDHYHRVDQDLDLAARIGLHDYRFSIAWSRVLPSGAGAVNPAGLDFYSRLVDGVLARGIRPVVTLYHWDLPQALQDVGGWTARDTSARFADYAALVAGALGDRVEVFTTLNEPWCSAFLGHASGAHAPGVQDAATAYEVAHHLLLAHGLAVPALRSTLPAGRQVSITLNTVNTRPASDSAEDRRAARDAELAQNQVFLEPLLTGQLHPELVERTKLVTDWGFVHDGDLRAIRAPLDFLGINYYNPHLVSASRVDGAQAWPGVADAWVVPEPAPVTGMGWPVRPETFTEMLVALDADYPGTTFVITENGAAYPDTVTAEGVADDDRVAYLRGHLGAVLDAVDAGVDVRGYYAWSLLDNFEWAWGYSQRFGLIHVDYATQERRLKRSAEVYADIIGAHAL
ncbi:beta-glucosidase [Jatrophihabitans endophyticus]|uniref:Beta-glucosidase n=1 Tax=Jatrophihabitans endophyticus TaxID=1206085 RepID=A0A1M5S4W9_9ACTN|nr:GH1 family beta-glucosidase [Jatrophihabitans endophyticus]SHH33637.1 beta-glucosidase [Jatrophihabitans endophyticus]